MKEKYQQYLKSPEWRTLRLKALAYALHKCQLCNGEKDLHVHHRVYPKVLGTEPVTDLTVLCNTCHTMFHKTTSYVLKAVKERERKALERGTNITKKSRRKDKKKSLKAQSKAAYKEWRNERKKTIQGGDKYEKRIDREGHVVNCPKCDTLLRAIIKNPATRSFKPNQKFYYSRWDRCPNCGYAKMYEKYKVMI